MTNSDFLPLRNLLPELNRARACLKLRPYATKDSARNALAAKNCPTIKPDTGHTLYHRESALRIATRQILPHSSPPPEYPEGRYTSARALLKEVNTLRSAKGVPLFHFRAGLITALIKANCPHARYGQDVIFHSPTARLLAPTLKRPACDITHTEHQAIVKEAAAQRAKILAWLAS